MPGCLTHSISFISFISFIRVVPPQMLASVVRSVVAVSPFVFAPWLCLVLPGVFEMLQTVYPFVLVFLLVSPVLVLVLLVLVLVLVLARRVLM